MLILLPLIGRHVVCRTFQTIQACNGAIHRTENLEMDRNLRIDWDLRRAMKRTPGKMRRVRRCARAIARFSMTALTIIIFYKKTSLFLQVINY